MSAYVITAAFSYLLGSVPFGYLLVRAFRGEDIRQSGSGNIGATNVARSSPLLGIATLLLDALKGLAAVLLARWFFPGNLTMAGVAALFAILGHVFPVWLKFRGGKGVATGLGSFVLLAPKAIVLAVAVFVAMVMLFRYVSLGSIVAVALLPLAAWLFDGYGHAPRMLLLMAGAAVLIICKHQGNLRRLAAGRENRFQWRRE
ncbi:MAG TPA: glycerol-3-phosphate 1-O-acyltransferase PlsY [Terriglobales bacterium]|nr:glycerol-3-phosphate 1-O-acyltransferase PlsY [Terriglobales bacterium]